MTGADAIARALVDAGVRAAWSFPGSPLTHLEIDLDRGKVPQHEFSLSEHVGVTMALAGAQLEGHRTAFLCKHVGINVALDGLATGAAHSLLRSGMVLIEGLDPLPKSSQNAQDNRAALASLSNLPLLEPGDPAECYALTRYAYRLSEAMRSPVVVRIAGRVLEDDGEVPLAPPDLPADEARFFLPGAPIVVTAATWATHLDQRIEAHERSFPSLSHLAAADIPLGARRGVIVAGQLGRVAASAARARGLASLRLGAAYPPPIPAILDFLGALQEVHIVEESQAYLGPWIAFLAATAGPGTRATLHSQVITGGGAVDLVLDDIAMSAPTGERSRSDAPALDVAGALAELPAQALDDRPWADAFHAARGDMKRFPERDPRRQLLSTLRVEAARLGRPSIVVADPGNTGVLGIGEGLVDVKWHMGSAAPAAAALARADRIADNPGRPLAIAVIGDSNYYHSEILGVMENGIRGRDVLHVILVNRRSEMTGGIRLPQLGDDALTQQLTAAGLAVSRVLLTDEAARTAAIIAAVSARGPRVLLVIDDRKDLKASDG